MATLESVRWTSSNPKITLTLGYEKKRSGADMQYRATVSISTLTGSSYFGYPIYLKLTIGDTLRETTTLKKASPSHWSTAITYTSAWYTVANKTTGTVPISFKVYSGSGSSRSATYSYSMPVDPAASKITAPNGTLGTALTLSLTRYNSSFTDTITYACGTASGTVKSGSTSGSVIWNTTNGNVVALAAQNTSGLSVEVTFTVRTYSGTTLVGTNTAKAKMDIPRSVGPSVALSITDAAGYLSTYDAYVQGYSKLRITATPTLAYGSPIKTYAITADGQSYSTTPVTTPALQGKGTLAVTAKVIDNRDRSSTTVSQDITVLEYSKPVVNLSAYRCDSTGTKNDEGSYMKIVLSATISSLSSKNSASYVITYKNEAGVTQTVSGTGTSYTSAAIPCDVANTRTISATVTDKLSNTTKTATIPIAYTLIDYHTTGRGIAFGKVGTREGFDCAMPAYFMGGVAVGDKPLQDFPTAYAVVDQTNSAGGTDRWQCRKYASGIMEAWGQFDRSFTWDGTSPTFYCNNAPSVDLPTSNPNFRFTGIDGVHVTPAASGVIFVGVATSSTSSKLTFSGGRLYGGNTPLNVTLYVRVIGKS